MTTQEYWERFEDNDIDTLTFFEDTCKFFSKEISPKDLEEYDFMDIILEVNGIFLQEKDYKSVIKLWNIIRENNKSFHKSEFLFLDDTMISYYAYLQDQEKVRDSFSMFMNYPIKDFDKYMAMFNTLIFWQCFDTAFEATSRNCDSVRNSNVLVENAEYELAQYHYSTIISNHYQKGKDSLDKAVIYTELKKINFVFTDESAKFFELGYLSENYDLEILKQEWSKKSFYFEILLKGYFCKYMYDKGMDVRLSSYLLSLILPFWKEKDTKSIHDFFQIKGFQKFLDEYMSSYPLVDVTHSMIAILWGSVYVYEFLEKIGLIPQHDLQKYLSEINSIKGKVIGTFDEYLWQVNFVHHWIKPDYIDESTFIQEKELFEETCLTKYEGLNDFKEKVKENFPLVVELGNFYDMEKEPLELEGFFGNLSRFNDDFFEAKYYGDTDSQPIKAERKVGRNEPCPCGSGKKYKKCCG